MLRRFDSETLVKNSFKKHGVDNPELEKAISEILNQAFDSRQLAKRLFLDITEMQEREKQRQKRFR